jgi:hypothetical protein
MASKDQSGEDFSGTLTVFLTEVAYLILMLLIIFFGVSVIGALEVFGGFMLISFVVRTTFAALIQRER